MRLVGGLGVVTVGAVLVLTGAGVRTTGGCFRPTARSRLSARSSPLSRRG